MAMKKPNRKKDSDSRRKRPKIKVVSHKIVFIEIPKKSKAGVAYIKYKPVREAIGAVIPYGPNRASRRSKAKIEVVNARLDKKAIARKAKKKDEKTK